MAHRHCCALPYSQVFKLCLAGIMQSDIDEYKNALYLEVRISLAGSGSSSHSATIRPNTARMQKNCRGTDMHTPQTGEYFCEEHLRAHLKNNPEPLVMMVTKQVYEWLPMRHTWNRLRHGGLDTIP